MHAPFHRKLYRIKNTISSLPYVCFKRYILFASYFVHFSFYFILLSRLFGLYISSVYFKRYLSFDVLIYIFSRVHLPTHSNNRNWLFSSLNVKMPENNFHFIIHVIHDEFISCVRCNGVRRTSIVASAVIIFLYSRGFLLFILDFSDSQGFQRFMKCLLLINLKNFLKWCPE